MTTPNCTKTAISREQIRAARALLGWTRGDLSSASGVPPRTLADLEQGARAPRARTVERVTAALEAAGIRFVAENGDGAGVRFRRDEP